MELKMYIVLMLAMFPLSTALAEENATNVTYIDVRNVGDNFYISLESKTGSTGYSWNATGYDPAAIRLDDNRTFPALEEMPGVSDMVVFTFTALEPGAHDLTMVYAWPWENEPTGEVRNYVIGVAENNITSFNATVGEEFDISMDENPTTGYTWNATYDESALGLANDSFEPYVNCTMYQCMEGMGGLRTFTFAPEKTGMTNITFNQVRGSEVEEPGWTFEINVQ